MQAVLGDLRSFLVEPSWMEDVFQSYSWQTTAGHVLAGVVPPGGQPEWEWRRIHAAMGIETKESILLSRNKESFEDALRESAVASPHVEPQRSLGKPLQNSSLQGRCGGDALSRP